MLMPPAAPSVVCAIEAIATAPNPVLVHCVAGKDRSGVVIAVTSRLLGIGHDPILDDYIQTDVAMAQILLRWRARMQSTNRLAELPEVPESHVRADRSTMQAFLDELDAQASGVEGWFAASGGTQDTIDRLRARLKPS